MPNKLLWISYFSFLAVAIPGGMLNINWVHIQKSFGLSLDSIGLLLMTGMMGSIAFNLASGQLIARVGLNRFLLAGGLIAGLGALGYMSVQSWEMLLLVNFGGSIGVSALITGVNTYATLNYPASRLNWLHASFGLGQAIGPILVTALVIDRGLPWQWSYAIAVILYFALSGCFALTFKQWQIETANATIPNAQTGKISQVSLRQTLALPAVWVGIALFFTSAGAEVSTGQLANSLFTQGRALDPKTVGVWISIYWLAFTIGRILFGVVVDRIGRSTLLRGCMFGAVLGGLIIWWNPSELLGFIGLALMGFSLSTIAPTLFSRMAGRVGAEHTANAVGLQMGAARLGLSLLPGIGGVLAERLGMEIIAPFLVAITLGMFLLHEFFG